MPTRADISGERFGRLVAQRWLHRTLGTSVWLCICDCGKQTEARLNNLRSGNTKSCGCGHVAGADNPNYKHGHSTGYTKTKEYLAWKGMVARCCNEKQRSWKRYGGRGITIYPEWRESFLAFFEHIGPAPSPKHSVDRIDNNDGYRPHNVRWATATIQARNTSRKSKRMPSGSPNLTAICEDLGIKYRTVLHRLWRGEPIERALHIGRLPPT